ncbi:unnamed protein product, partial [Oikopleura dioica]
SVFSNFQPFSDFFRVTLMCRGNQLVFYLCLSHDRKKLFLCYFCCKAFSRCRVDKHEVPSFERDFII